MKQIKIPLLTFFVLCFLASTSSLKALETKDVKRKSSTSVKNKKSGGQEIKEKIWVGQLVKLSSDVAPLSTHPYYLFFVNDGKAIGLPIEVIPNLEKKLSSLAGKNVRVEGAIVKKWLQLGEGKKEVEIVAALDISAISLNSLQTTPENTSHVSLGTSHIPKQTSRDQVQRPTMTIPDNVANGIIFGAGALLIGSILKDELKK